MTLTLSSLPKERDRRLHLLKDEELLQAIEFIEGRPDFFTLLGSAVRDAFDAVVDFPNTGRRTIHDRDVVGNEKTFVGTKVERRLETLLWTEERGEEMDLTLGGVETDAKFTMTAFNSWMIPEEAYRGKGQLCLCVFADDKGTNPTYDAVLIRASRDRLRDGKNRDKKLSFQSAAMLQYGLLLQGGHGYRASFLHHISDAQAKELFRIDGPRRLVRAAEMIVDNRIPVSLHSTDILMLARSSNAYDFIESIHDRLEEAGIEYMRGTDGSVRFKRSADSR